MKAIHNTEKSIDIEKMINSRRYKSLNFYQKEKIIIQLFHSSNFYSINSYNRIILLQEFENIRAKIEKRESFKIIVLSHEYKFNELLMDMRTVISQKKIFIRKSLLENAIRQFIIDNKSGIQKVKVEDLNLFLLDCLLHEQYHINTRHSLNKYQNNQSYLKKEHKEQLLFMFARNKEREENNNNLLEGKMYLYRTIPDEYYAYLYAETKLYEYFQRLNEQLGYDENLSLYQRRCNFEKKQFELSYLYFEKQALKCEEIYHNFLNNLIEYIVAHSDNTKEEYIKDLQKSKKFIKETNL